ncbi:PadR family transcriptional regulator [Mangrovihabitans endophyticus]|nr:PadR family transcriptional regulator [Mangrovihabitans endophyticus]
MSATRMMILGLVQWMQPVHGYDVRRELLSWNADKWAHVQPGSIYHALRKLSEEELIRPVATEQVGARPARTTYEITDKGAAEFMTLLRDAWWQVGGSPERFMAGFSFLPALPRAEAAAALRNRIVQLTVGVQQLRAAMSADWARRKPSYVSWLWELTIDRHEAEMAWCERTAQRIESGERYMPDGGATPDMWNDV